MPFGGVKASGNGAGSRAPRRSTCTPRAVRQPRRRPRARVTVAVLGLGGIGGILAAPTGRSASAPSGRSTRSARAGLRSSDGGETIIAHPEVDDAARAAGRAPRRRGQGLRPRRRRSIASRPSTLDGAVVLPLLNGLEHVERSGGGSSRLQQCVASAVRCRRRVDRARVGVLAGARRRRPGRAGGAEITAASADLDRVTLGRGSSRSPRPGSSSSSRRRAGGALGEGRTACRARRRDGGVRSTDRRAPGRPRLARRRLRDGLGEAVAAAAADGVALAAADQWAIIEAMPPEVTTSAARDAAAGRPTELDAIAGSVVRAGRRHGVPMPALERLLRDAEEATRAVTSTHAEPVRRPPADASITPTSGSDAAGRARRPRPRRPLRARRRRARVASLRVLRLGLRPRDLLAVRVAARPPARAVQHDRPADAARRPRRARDRAAGAARDPGGRRRRGSSSSRRSRSRRPHRSSTSWHGTAAPAAGWRPFPRCSGAHRPSCCVRRCTTSIRRRSCPSSSWVDSSSSPAGISSGSS